MINEIYIEQLKGYPVSVSIIEGLLVLMPKDINSFNRIQVYSKSPETTESSKPNDRPRK